MTATHLLNVRKRTIPIGTMAQRRSRRVEGKRIAKAQLPLSLKQIRSAKFQRVLNTLVKYWGTTHPFSGQIYPAQHDVIAHLINHQYISLGMAKSIAAMIRPEYARQNYRQQSLLHTDVVEIPLSLIFITNELYALGEAYSKFWLNFKPVKPKAKPKRKLKITQAQLAKASISQSKPEELAESASTVSKVSIEPVKPAISIPSNETVAHWLQSQYGFSRNLAQCGAKLIRPDFAPKCTMRKTRTAKRHLCIQPITRGFLGSQED